MNFGNQLSFLWIRELIVAKVNDEEQKSAFHHDDVLYIDSCLKRIHSIQCFSQNVKVSFIIIKSKIPIHSEL